MDSVKKPPECESTLYLNVCVQVRGCMCAYVRMLGFIHVKLYSKLGCLYEMFHFDFLRVTSKPNRVRFRLNPI